MRASHPISNPLGTWRGKALLRFFLLVVAAAAVAAFASRFGVSHDYAYLHASLLAGAGVGCSLSHHELDDQARLVGQGKLDLAAVVMEENAALLRTVVNQYDLDTASFQDLEGLVARHPWLGLGHIPAGLYDLVRPTPAVDKPVARINTLVVANSCARRAERVALLMLLSAELPGFVQANPPKYTYSATALPLAAEARQYFIKGEPELADLYFPWLVNLMSPAYWVYFVMAATILFNALKGISRFRLWRIDAARERLERRLKELTDPGLTHAQIRVFPDGHSLTGPSACAAARASETNWRNCAPAANTMPARS